MAQNFSAIITEELHRILGLSTNGTIENLAGCNLLSPRAVLVHYIGTSLCASLQGYVQDVLYVGSSYEGTSIEQISDNDLMLDLTISSLPGWSIQPADVYGPAHCEIIAPDNFKETDLLDQEKCISPKKVLQNLKLKVEQWQLKFKASTSFFRKDNVTVSFTRTSGPSVPLTVEFTPDVVTAADIAKECLACLRALLEKISTEMPSVVSEGEKKHVLDYLNTLEKEPTNEARKKKLTHLEESGHGLYETIANLVMGVECKCLSKTNALGGRSSKLVQQSPVSFSVDLVPTLSLIKFIDGKKKDQDYVAKPPRVHYNWIKIDQTDLSTPTQNSVVERIDITGKFKAFVNKHIEKNAIKDLSAWTHSRGRYILIEMTDKEIQEVTSRQAPGKTEVCELCKKTTEDRINPETYFIKLKSLIKKWIKESSAQTISIAVKKSPCRRALTVTYKEESSQEVKINMIPVIRPKRSTVIYAAIPSTSRCWRESYSRQERDKLKKLNNKSVIYGHLMRVFKLMRCSVPELKAFPNYCFKNILLWLSDKRSSWKNEDLTKRFLDMVQEFICALDEKELKQYFNNEVNLLADETKFTSEKIHRAKNVLIGESWNGGEKLAKLLTKVDLHKAVEKAKTCTSLQDAELGIKGLGHAQQEGATIYHNKVEKCAKAQSERPKSSSVKLPPKPAAKTCPSASKAHPSAVKYHPSMSEAHLTPERQTCRAAKREP